jgi:alkylation response protein AidB-like acyl-CoA dehydrogenase
MEVAAGDGAVSTLMSVNNAPVCAILCQCGTELQKRRFLVPLARGEMIGAFALTEPQAGSDAANLRTQALRREGGYLLSGAKQFITSGSIAGVTITFAVTHPDLGKRGITAFLVPAGSEGLAVGRVESKLGQRASDTAQLTFSDVFVPEELRIGSESQGYRIALSNLETGRIGIAAQSVGMAAAAFELARAYARERRAFGKPIADHQGVAFRLADMATQLEAGLQLVLHAAALKDAGRPCLKEASMAKLFASEAAERICSAAIQVHGGYGYVTDFLVEKIYRDVRVCQIYEGTSDIQRMLIARELF